MQRDSTQSYSNPAVWTVPCSNGHPRTPPPSYFSVVSCHHDYSSPQNQSLERTCSHQHCSSVNGVSSSQTIIIVPRARRQITCTGKKMGLFILTILMTLGLIISPLIWVLTSNYTGWTSPADPQPRTPPPPYFSIEHDHLYNVHNQNFDTAFDPLDNSNHSIQTLHPNDGVLERTVFINSEPTKSCNTGQVFGRLTVILLIALCFLMIRLFIRSMF